MGQNGQRENAQRRLGEFTLEEQLGRGGMGLVYRARQDSLERVVALKILPGSASLDPDAVARFRREAEAAGRLNHPGIVPIHAVGEEDGVHYYAMELVEGPSLQAILLSLGDRDPASLTRSLIEESGLVEAYPQMRVGERSETQHQYARSCVALIAEVANALAAAHAAHVIHRDVKPSNILLHPTGRPMLADFGLARDGSGAELTRTGDAVGTPSYMSPEQAAGAEIDARADIYGLGATLYELLALRPPFDGDNGAEIMRRILEEDADWVRRANPRVPADLAAIVHCCLAKDPDERYLSAADLEHDLRAFLAGRPVAARWQVAGPLRRWVRRNQRTLRVAVMVTGSAVLAAALGGLLLFQDSARRGREALQLAHERLVAGQFAGVEEAYGRAVALLGSDQVLAARRSDLLEVFDEHYAAGRYGELERCLSSIPLESWGEREQDLARRLAGRGVLELEGPSDGRLRVEYRHPFAEASSWRSVPADGSLALGDVLVRQTAPGAAPVVQRARIERDRTTRLRMFPPPQELAQDQVVIVDAQTAVAIDRTELTAARYAKLLEILDPALRAELIPSGWAGPYPPGDPGEPVVGLSFQQARAAAALLGGHLPSPAEYLEAGTAGLPDWPYPWGPRPDPQRVAADPAHLGRPMKADSLPVGASPLGVLHLVGNAAEFLGAFEVEPLQLAGGHFGSEPGSVSLATRELLQDPTAGRPYAGLRLARFLFLEGEVAAELPEADVHWRWSLDGDGSMSLRVRSAGGALPSVRRFPGFDVIEARSNAPSERQWLLRPIAGVRGSGDGYFLELPLHPTQERTALHELLLPPGVTVVESSIPPEGAVMGGEGQQLWWSVSRAGGLGPIWLLLRKDGPLTRRWPVRREVEAALERFFDAWRRRDRSDLERCTSPSFHYTPAQWLRQDSHWSGPQPDEEFLDWQLVDCTAVGDVITAELDVVWRPLDRERQAVELSAWPLRVQMVRSGGLPLVQRIAPAGGWDGGAMVSDARYWHSRLGLEVQVPVDTLLARVAGARAEVQVRCIPQALAGAETPEAEIVILGSEMSPDDSAELADHRMTGGDAVVAPGELWTGRRTDIVGSEESGTAYAATSEHWLFRSGADGWRRERWTHLQVGRRRLLARASVLAADRRQAEELFRRWQPWFDRVLVGVGVR